MAFQISFAIQNNIYFGPLRRGQITSIRFLSMEEGGRSSPLLGGGSYRPNHNFFGADNRDMCMGFIELPEGQQVAPGDTIQTKNNPLDLCGCSARNWRWSAVAHTRRRYPRPLLAPGRPKLIQLMRARSSISSNHVIRKKAAINCRPSFIRLTQPRSPLAGGGGGGGGTGQAAVARITVPSTQVCVAGASTTGGIGGGTYSAGFGCFQPRSSFAPMRK